LWGDFREKLKIARTSQKSHLVKTSYTAVNEKGEFAGNVQFVAVGSREPPDAQQDQTRP
jgi:hypothetical protein